MPRDKQDTCGVERWNASRSKPSRFCNFSRTNTVLVIKTCTKVGKISKGCRALPLCAHPQTKCPVVSIGRQLTRHPKDDRTCTRLATNSGHWTNCLLAPQRIVCDLISIGRQLAKQPQHCRKNINLQLFETQSSVVYTTEIVH